MSQALPQSLMSFATLSQSLCIRPWIVLPSGPILWGSATPFNLAVSRSGVHVSIRKVQSYWRSTSIISFILQFVRRRLGIEVLRDELSVKSEHPLVVPSSFLLERVYSLECKNGNCVRWTAVSTTMILECVRTIDERVYFSHRIQGFHKVWSGLHKGIHSFVDGLSDMRCV